MLLMFFVLKSASTSSSFLFRHTADHQWFYRTDPECPSALNRFVCQRAVGCNPFTVADAIIHLTNHPGVSYWAGTWASKRDPATLKVTSSDGRLRRIAPARRSVFSPIQSLRGNPFPLTFCPRMFASHGSRREAADRCRVGSRTINTSLGVRAEDPQTWVEKNSFITLLFGGKWWGSVRKSVPVFHLRFS